LLLVKASSTSEGDREAAAVGSLITAESAVMSSAEILLPYIFMQLLPSVSLLKFSLPSAQCSTTHLPREFASVFQRDICLPYMHRNCIVSAESDDTHICV